MNSFRLAALLFISATCTFAASITYSVSAYQLPAGTNTDSLTGINNSGQAVGYALNTSTSVFEAFIATTSGDTLVASPDGSSADAFGINSSGVIAGFYGNSPVAGFFGTGSGSTAVPLPAGYSGGTNAYDINDAGQVVGTGIGQPFVYSNGTSTVVPLPTGFSGGGGFAINSSGQVAGYGSNPSSNSQAFIGDTSGSTAIPLPTGFTSTRGYAINDSGQIAGYGKNSSNQNQAYIGTTAGSTAIPLPTGATFATAMYGSLNNSGEVVGASAPGGWIWDATDGTQLLTSLVPTGWTVTSAISVSDTGLILAQGKFNNGATQYLELSPNVSSATPEPGAIGLMISGGLLMGLLSLRNKLR